MDASKADSFFLRSTSAVSLNERFSKGLVDQLTQSRMVTFDPVLLQQRRVRGPPPAVLLVKRQTSSPLSLQTRDSSVRAKQRRRRRRSVWTRLGWQQVTRRLSASRPRGFWSFRHKFRWRARFTSTYRRWGDLRGRLGQRRLLVRRNIQELTAGQFISSCENTQSDAILCSGRTRLSLHLQRGGAAASRGRGLSKDHVPTKKQLDAQLDEYMSLSKSRLDAQLDDYMSMSRSRLDAELDEYMSMAGQAAEGGQAELHWD
ncbi:chromatin target of PRMT1 protein-like isoform X1 [Siniperca chuatsi]|uniref:chromatin target of PRMT1 protein-like isoform X1 n=1 Tax=Siniperca chuatsi TaxID=119488 RepID=UPI001CE15FCB|nr:chromatin target of PRMT1 protein-like isoform X1 [Siniperca chuatsi]XP_044062694.1 chromatin target of PRMT1 protein-like isoform X1 [Siniperca chuatsi]XP_044062695.1 chromatin target of PRMT1 protein-like isoform X1 [Siniperca chuatsi]XP_044062696.1 chromatin target of PRMT1 protein-like isoform X1 [Siniperca chuatsi]XP_044062697.1 chromatin target of PRMT1 protein-like isoform X1 [Siniperca chuatsi]XP_044062698.1 chromatin target of PRMT1 protein-like isoform X1 [Siniperca chuatsi]